MILDMVPCQIQGRRHQSGVRHSVLDMVPGVGHQSDVRYSILDMVPGVRHKGSDTSQVSVS